MTGIIGVSKVISFRFRGVPLVLPSPIHGIFFLVLDEGFGFGKGMPRWFLLVSDWQEVL